MTRIREEDEVYLLSQSYLESQWMSVNLGDRKTWGNSWYEK